MTTAGDDVDDVFVDEPGSGHLSEISRAAAIAAALPLVATYFSRGPSSEAARRIGTAHRAKPGRHDPTDERVLAAIRLRVAITSGRQLAELLRNVLRRPNFRYQLVRDEQVGHLHGRLDTMRYLRDRGRRSMPRRYPTIDIQRGAATPENVLAAFSLHWLVTELDVCMTYVAPPVGSREAVDVAEVRRDLVRLAGSPVLRGATAAASDVLRRESLQRLLDTVESRLRAGHVARPAPYAELAEWVRQALVKYPLATEGDLETAFPGAEFDDKLFELWCVAQLIDALTLLLGQPKEQVTDLLARGSDPISRWDGGTDIIELYFQPPLDKLASKPARWKYMHTGQGFRGYPDLGVRCRHFDGTADIVLIDAKLRQRPGPPGEEIYKLLGYFANVTGLEARRGAIVFHDVAGFQNPDGDRRYTLEHGQDDGVAGHVEAVGVDPRDAAGSRAAFHILAGLVLEATGISSDAAAAVASSAEGPDDEEADGDERLASRTQALASAQLVSLSARAPVAALDASAAHLRTVLGSAWVGLGADVERMAVSAMHFGDTAPDGADLAGPVLGLCAALERILRDRCAVPALASARTRPGCDATRWTLGTLLSRIGEATGPGPWGPAARGLRQYLATQRVPRVPLAQIIPELDRLRARHRNKAAHQGLVERHEWTAVCRVVLLADDALLPRLVRLFPD